MYFASNIHGLVTFLCCIIIVVKEKQNSLDAIFVRPPKTHLMHFSSVHQKLLLRTITLKLRIIRMQNFQRLLLINYFHNLTEGIFFGNEHFILSFAQFPLTTVFSNEFMIHHLIASMMDQNKHFLVGIYLLRINTENTRTMCEICSKLSINFQRIFNLFQRLHC